MLHQYKTTSRANTNSPNSIKNTTKIESGNKSTRLLLLINNLNGLHKTKPQIFHILNSILLNLLQFLIHNLELLDLKLEGLLGLRDLRLLAANFLLQVRHKHHLKLLNLHLLGIITEVEVSRETRRLQLGLRIFLQTIKIAATLIILKHRGISVLDGGVSLHTHLLAQRLTINRAVTVSDEHILVALVFRHKLVPCWLHGFAVASPRRLKLDKNRLAGRQLLKVVLRQRGS